MAEYLDSELKQTADEGKRLWTLVSRYTRLEMVDKLTFILSGLLLGGVLVGIAVVVVFCLSMFCITLLQAWDVGQPLSYVVMALLLSGAGYAILRKKEKLVTRPLLQALLREFFPAEEKTASAGEAAGTADAFSTHTVNGTPKTDDATSTHTAATGGRPDVNSASTTEDDNPATETSRPS